MFTLFTGRHVGGRTKEVLQHGGSILRSIILCGTFRRKSQLCSNAHSLNLENCLLYLSSTISQFLTLCVASFFNLIFFIAWQCTHSILQYPNSKISQSEAVSTVLRYQVSDLTWLPYHVYLSQNFTQRQKHVNLIFLIETDNTWLTRTSYLII